MKLGAFTALFNEVRWLRAIAAQLDVFDRVVIALSTKTTCWVGHLMGMDRPEAPIEEVQDLCSDHGYELVMKDWSENFAGQCQEPLELLHQDCDAAVWFATDELYTVNDAKKLYDMLVADPGTALRPGKLHTLWHNEDWCVCYPSPVPGLPRGFQMGEVQRGGQSGFTANAVDVTCWHFAFARPPAEMKFKYLAWGHAWAGCPALYEEWAAWKPATNNHMTWPSCHAGRTNTKLPAELVLRLGPLYDELMKHESDTLQVCSCGFNVPPVK